MIIIRLFFIVSAIFLLLVVGLSALLLFKMRLTALHSLMHRDPPSHMQNSRGSGPIIEGEYKIVENEADKK